MLKNLKMAGKMILGFGAVLIVIAVIILITVMNMLSIQTLANEMDNEFLPEVSVANNLERHSLLTMYNMRGYALNFSDDYLSAGKDYLSEVEKSIKEADDLASRYTDLVKLKETIGNVEAEVAAYSSGAAQTEQVISQIIAQRLILDESASVFKAQTSAFLESQEAQYREDLNLAKSDAAMIERMRKIYLINDVIDLGNEARVNAFKAQLNIDYKIADLAVEYLKEIDGKLSDLMRITRQQKNIDEINDIDEARTLYSNALQTIAALYKQLDGLNTTRGEAADSVLASAQAVSGAGLEQTISKAKTSVETITGSLRIIIVGFLIAIAISVLIAVFLTLSITRALKKGVDFAQDLSEGDLRIELDVVQKDEIGKLADALRNMKDKLKEVVQEVKGSAIMVSQGSQQLANTAEQISQGATEQASTAEEVSSSMEEIGASIRQNTDNASQTEKIATKAAEDAETGGTAVLDAVEAMNLIAQKIKVIEEIARNTNLLSLNAAIEAARAGEHGKGFAVVATEVGKLAANSQIAANEILELANTSVQKANNAGEKIQAMIPDIRRTADLVQEITATSMEQNSGAEQVNQVMIQLDQVIQQNAAAAEESSSMSEELSSQAEKLIEMIDFFKIEERANYSTPKSTNRSKPGPIKLENVSRPALKLEAKISEKIAASSADDDFEEF